MSRTERTCRNGHQNRREAIFCDQCAQELLPGGSTETGISALDAVREIFLEEVDGGLMEVPIRNIDGYGQNHRMMATAVLKFAGEVLTAADITRLVLEQWPNFNVGSILPNDHADGNASPCGCAGTSDRLADRVGRGRYRIRKSEVDVNDSASSLNVDLIQSLPSARMPQRRKFSEWLLEVAPFEISARLPDGAKFVPISGTRSRPGRYPAAGVLLRPTGESFSIGVDRNFDFLPGEQPQKLPYLGWRGGSYQRGAGPEGRLVHRRLKSIFPEQDWLAPDKWWSTHRNLPVLRGVQLMNESEYLEFVVDTFVVSYTRLLEGRYTPINQTEQFGDKGRPTRLWSPSLPNETRLIALSTSSPAGDALVVPTRQFSPKASHFTMDDLENGIAIWERKAITAEWPRDFHNAMYVIDDMRRCEEPFSQRWWIDFVMPRVGTWRAYRPATKADIERWAFECLSEMKASYETCVAPFVDTPFDQLRWEDVAAFTEVVARAKRNVYGGVQASPVFRSKVCHWIAPRLFPVADQEVLGINSPYEIYWKEVQKAWAAIPLEIRETMIARLSEEIRRNSRHAVADNYPFEVKIVELCRIGRANR